LLASKRFNPQQIHEILCQTNRAGGVLNAGLETLSNREMFVLAKSVMLGVAGLLVVVSFAAVAPTNRER